MEKKLKEVQFRNKEFREICEILIHCERFKGRNLSTRVSQIIRNLAETLFRDDAAAANYLLNPNARAWVKDSVEERKEDDCDGCGKKLSLKEVRSLLDEQGVKYNKNVKSVEKLTKLLK